MTDIEVLLPAPLRTNTTPLHDNHPDDHNVIVDALNTLSDFTNNLAESALYRVYASTTARDLDITAHVDGMLTWAISERIVAVWHGEWYIVREPYRPWTPVLNLGGVAVTNITPPTRESGYRHDFGVCTFNMSCRFGPIPAGITPTAPLVVTPPLAPTSEGGFGVAYCVDLGGTVAGAIGTAGVCNATQLSILKPPTGLVARSDLGADGSNFECYMSGQFATAMFSV